MFVLVYSVVAFVLLKQIAEFVHVQLMESINVLSCRLFILHHSNGLPHCREATGCRATTVYFIYCLMQCQTVTFSFAFYSSHSLKMYSVTLNTSASWDRRDQGLHVVMTKQSCFLTYCVDGPSVGHETKGVLENATSMEQREGDTHEAL